jgi:hypothetical protein
MAGRGSSVLAMIAASIGIAGAARATPTTTVWAPSTTAIQPYLTPHLTYDTYFWNKGSAGSTSSPIYPVTTGLTMGVLPFEDVQLELGFDLLLPASDPLLLNAKLGIPEDKLLSWAPSFAIGIAGVGTASATRYDMLYGQLQHSFPFGGFLSAGAYYALNDANFHASTGEVQRAGFIGGVGSPDINLNLPWLQKITFAADVQTGNNAFGAAGGAVSLYFTDKVSVLTGPIYFFDRDTQPGSSRVMWTMQLDIDMPLRSSPPAAPAAPIAH